MVGAGEGPTFHVTYYHLDHLGSPRVLTDSNGVRVQGQHFLPFGEEMPIEAGVNSRKFTGHERDAETGLDYMVARYYSAPLGRFLTPDALRFQNVVEKKVVSPRPAEMERVHLRIEQPSQVHRP